MGRQQSVALKTKVVPNIPGVEYRKILKVLVNNCVGVAIVSVLWDTLACIIWLSIHLRGDNHMEGKIKTLFDYVKNLCESDLNRIISFVLGIVSASQQPADRP